MLERTFIHVPGVGREMERALWRQGARDWATYLEDPASFPVRGVDAAYLADRLLESRDALKAGHYQHFAASLGTKEAWRAWPAFRHSTVYLDIETDGGKSGSSVTVIGLYDGTEFRALVQGDDIGDFLDLISRYSMIVSFFGTGFDVPMLQRRFRTWRCDQLHFDLCPTLRRIGIKGGLKRIEKDFGIARTDETDGLTGYDAVKLWRRYRYGDEKALQALVEYNREDVVNLEKIAALAYPMLVEDAMALKAVIAPSTS